MKQPDKGTSVRYEKGRAVVHNQIFFYSDFDAFTVIRKEFNTMGLAMFIKNKIFIVVKLEHVYHYNEIWTLKGGTYNFNFFLQVQCVK